jgi:hypothetical protein
MASRELVSFEMTFLLHFGLDDDMPQSFWKHIGALIFPKRIVIHKPITVVTLENTEKHRKKKSIRIQLKNWGWWSSIGDCHRFISFYDWFMSHEIFFSCIISSGRIFFFGWEKMVKIEASRGWCIKKHCRIAIESTKKKSYANNPHKRRKETDN